MAALVVDSGFDLTAFRIHLTKSLPAYAMPVFLRLVPALAATGTFKPRKADLIRDGFDPARVADPLYFGDAQARAYVALDPALYAALVGGQRRL
jgi:fatty-acyl-CoA synthase